MRKTVIALLGLLLLCACQSQFTADSWASDREKRSEMLSDLLNKNNNLVGKTENEIIALMGKPEEKLDEPSSQYVYYLGRAGLGVDDSLLVLQFDENWKVESHKIRYD
ncbi:hypothetical protein [Paenibacillus radicis (ex Gao et al. 2016)]|uniref:Lipoprotein SmpA/OmlA domain-containing protein n=1 Tax=Paenibacillus radicis (ex Gao et al. 2016) TaxID=1737354 RepID=A0A917GR07_9BACL|nr:hypothetical protein [Paenibacillus radicis (ex Gao et al. 2016)]GGG54646.1 hypothetical protein GCM10010918_04400 [Paenibacillus radicis (ex Gao et al. 2016)]